MHVLRVKPPHFKYPCWTNPTATIFAAKMALLSRQANDVDGAELATPPLWIELPLTFRQST
jgi:hypothetical protein